jgi:tripartite-type tricarboxylate transporter receptor subunit TctC
MRTHWLVITAVASSVLAAGTLLPYDARAADYPTKTVRFVIGFSAGGGTDIAGRILAQRLTEDLKQTFIVENRAGASGTIGADYVAKAPPDGYTLFIGSPTTHSVVPQLLAKPPYHPLRDFAGVSELVYSPMLVVVHPSVPAKNIKELIRLAKSRPGDLTYGSGGVGATPHMAGELFKLATGIKMLHIPYKGEAPAVVDLVGGQITLVFANLPVALPHARAGRLRGLAMTSKERLKAAPDFPTVSESGVPGFEAGTWFGMFAPKATPQEIVAKLSADCKAALTGKAAEDKLAEMGYSVVASNPVEFTKRMESEYAKWGKVIKQARIKMQ